MTSSTSSATPPTTTCSSLPASSKARGVICALNDDKSNLFVTISARALNPDDSDRRQVDRALHGAQAPPRRRGCRGRAELHRRRPALQRDGEPQDDALPRPDRAVRWWNQRGDRGDRHPRLEPAGWQSGSPRPTFARRERSSSRSTGPSGDYVYNPGSEQVLHAGDSLIVLAESDDVTALKGHVAG